MKIFLTGASGYVGRHIAEELLARGQDVVGLARKPSPRTAKSGKMEWCFADLAQFEVFSDSIKKSDCVIHCAMSYSDSGNENTALDLAFIQHLIHSEKFFIYTGNLYSSRPYPEEVFLEEVIPKPSDWRLQNENAILESGIAAAIIRLGFVYGGKGGYLWDMLPPHAMDSINLEEIEPAYWPMVHVRDVATLYATVAEQQATGVFHAYDGTEITAKSIFAKLIDVYPPDQASGEGAHDHIYDLLNKSIRTTHARALSTGWKPAFDRFDNNAAQAYSDYLSAK